MNQTTTFGFLVEIDICKIQEILFVIGVVCSEWKVSADIFCIKYSSVVERIWVPEFSEIPWTQFFWDMNNFLRRNSSGTEKYRLLLFKVSQKKLMNYTNYPQWFHTK